VKESGSEGVWMGFKAMYDGVSWGEWCIGFMTMEEHNILSYRQWNRIGIWKELTVITMEARQCKDDVLLENN
jgi:hypothetical protein